MSTRNPYGDGPGYSQGQGMSETHTHDQMCQCERCEGVLGIKAYRQTVLTEDQRLREENDRLKRRVAQLEDESRWDEDGRIMETLIGERFTAELERDALTRRVEALEREREAMYREHDESREERDDLRARLATAEQALHAFEAARGAQVKPKRAAAPTP